MSRPADTVSWTLISREEDNTYYYEYLCVVGVSNHVPDHLSRCVLCEGSVEVLVGHDSMAQGGPPPPGHSLDWDGLGLGQRSRR